ncbi:glycosyltransferase [Sphingobacterium cellulitidis]|uniref:Glycosyl transferase family 1 n=1 Tax=Sphingobacterium cellulitidis TaxID=1768011 RepID=A0A8H9G265_9SPHI|nr:glycosyltransferase [Sphingobacterium soli]MBA8986266.1 rhamnosyl/mannosyltransferase [Sphingobacterium soli]OYD42798.1 glycosyl transferase family 1 [Sphingobacterium cellulitidis]GGE18896.1 glycosyl transferase family 1 [Sphingobacterium soli]
MRVLQLGKFYPIRGGVEKVEYDLMLGLSNAGIHCDMLCASTEDHPSATIHLNKFATLFVMPTQINAAATKLAPQMITRLKKIANNYDIIHIHHPDPMATLALFLSNYKGKVVLHWHSDILKQKTLLRLYKPLQNWLIKRADIIVGTTPVYVEQSKFLKNVQSKIDFIPIGVDVEEDLSPLVNGIKEKHQNRKIIFSLGRLVEYKGYEYLIKSAKYLDDNYKIVIGGKGPLKEELEKIISDNDLGNKVQLLGFMTDEEVKAYYQACDLFCLSSILKTEAFAIVQIEAMGYGKPVVSTRIPESGVSWVNQNGLSGLTVEICDERALADSFQTILTEEEVYKSLSDGAKKRYLEHFTREKMVDKCLQIYNKILA